MMTWTRWQSPHERDSATMAHIPSNHDGSLLLYAGWRREQPDVRALRQNHKEGVCVMGRDMLRQT